MAVELQGRAPAKVNLTLEVLGRREDGYHELRSVLQTLALSDSVVLRLGSAAAGVHVTGPFAAGTPADETNLAWRAATLLLPGDELARLELRLEKQIPPAGGLGGGASDAATVLRLLGLYRGIDDGALLEAANRLGSDEAALILGGTVLLSGRGDVVRPLPPLPAHDVVLFVPAATVAAKTATMFAALGRQPFDDGSVTRAFAVGRAGVVHSQDVYNAFERVAFDVFPGLAALWAELEERVGAAVRLAGAGPTLFWIGSPGRGAGIAEAARGAACTIITTCTEGSLWRR